MRIDLEQVGQLTRSAFDFVLEQTKRSVSETSKAATWLFKSFLDLTGQSTKAVAGALGFSGSVKGQRSDDQTVHLPHLSDELMAALLNGAINGCGAIVSGGELERLIKHFKTIESVDLGDGFVLEGIGDSSGGKASDASRFAVVSKAGQKTFEVPLTEVGASNDRQLAEDIHLARLLSLGRFDVVDEASPSSSSAAANQASTSASPSSLPLLTLVGKTPAKVRGNQAYRQPAIENLHCGVQAVNGFFQTKVVDAGDLIRALIKSDPALRDGTRYSGAFHPTLMESFLNGDQGVSITYDEFKKNTGSFKEFASDDGSVDDQWRRIHNAVLGPGAPKQDELHVKPGHWLTARGGVEAESIANCMNELLKTKDGSWGVYPDQVGVTFLFSEGSHQQFADVLTQKASVKQMICYSEKGRHWFPMVRSGDQWLRLDQVNESERKILEDRGSLNGDGLLDVPRHGQVSASVNALAGWLKSEGVRQIICDAQVTI